MSKAIATNVIFHSRMQQKGIKHDQDQMLEKIKVAYENKADLPIANLDSKIQALIEQDKQQLEVFNQTARDPQYKIHFAVKVNKLGVVIDKGLPKLLGDENAISSIVSGKLPGNLDNNIGESLPNLGSGEYYGGGNLIYVSALLHYASLASGLGAGYAISNNSAAYYSNPLPENFPKSADYFSWYSDKDHALVVPHGGYAWGAHRNQNTNNPFAPHDCASLIETYTIPQLTASTADLMCIWNVNTGEFDGWRPQEWGSESLTALYQPLKPEDAQMGDIYFHKLIKDTPKDTVYAGGHAAVTIFTSGGEVKATGANRDLEREFAASPQPGLEGIGLQSFQIPTAGKFIGFLRATDKMTEQMPDPFGINGFDWGHEPCTLENVVQYYDSHYGHAGIPLSGGDSFFGDSAAAHD